MKKTMGDVLKFFADRGFALQGRPVDADNVLDVLEAMAIDLTAKQQEIADKTEFIRKYTR